MSGSATLATDRFRFATPATRISESRTSPARAGAWSLPPRSAVIVAASTAPPSGASPVGGERGASAGHPEVMGATRTDERGTAARTLGAIVLEAADRYDSTALKYKSGEDWKDVSFGELGKSVRGIARGLIAMGIEPGDRVAVIGETRPEWTYADFGALCAGAGGRPPPPPPPPPGATAPPPG